MRTGKAAGSVTAFLSLVLVLILSLLAVCWESARREGQRLRLCLAAEASTQAVLASYDRLLWDRYGLLFFASAAEDCSDALAIASRYAAENTAESGEYTGADLTRLTQVKVTMPLACRASEQNGAVFRSAAADYMRGCGLAEAALDTFSDLEQLGLKDQEEPDLDSLLDLIQSAQSMADPDSGDSDPDGRDSDPAGISGSTEQGGSLTPPDATEEETREARKTLQRMTSEFRKWKRNGILALALEDPDQVSDAKYDMTDWPSRMSKEQKQAEHADLDTKGDNVLFREYVVRQLDQYVGSEGRSCAVEYVIAGRNSDKANLQAVLRRILALRYTVNLAAVYADSALRNQTDTMALLAAGWTCSGDVVTAVSQAIRILWAYAESVSELKILMRGGKVPAVKDHNSWNTTLGKGLTEKAGIDRDDGEGLTYAAYLRVLLSFEGAGDEAYRTMDMIQREICRSESGFRFQNCLYGLQFTYEAQADTVLAFLPGNGGAVLTETVWMSYGASSPIGHHE